MVWVALIRAAVLVGLLTPLLNVNAALVATPNGVKDTATHKEWLPFTATQGISFGEVEAGYGGYVNDRWRYATTDEIVQLFLDAGANPLGFSGGNYQDSYDAARLLISLLGYTIDGSNDSGVTLLAEGITGHEDAPGVRSLAIFGFNEYLSGSSPNSGVFYPGTPYAQPGDVPSWYESQDIGSFLIRDFAVPEPDSLGLSLTAVALIAFARRHQPSGLCQPAGFNALWRRLRSAISVRWRELQC